MKERPILFSAPMVAALPSRIAPSQPANHQTCEVAQVGKSTVQERNHAK